MRGARGAALGLALAAALLPLPSPWPSPSIARADNGGGDPSGTLAGVYAWSSADRSRLNLVMTVAPNAGSTAHFSPLLQYAFHVSSRASYGGPVAEQTNIICTFDAAGAVQCWIGGADYVAGDASQPGGVTSASGRVKVFTGLRNDPRFFNLAGFQAAAAAVHASGAPTDGAGCPPVQPATATALRGYLSGDGTNPSGTPKDFYAGQNVLAIVLSIDPTLVVKDTNPIVSVWGSTHSVP